MRALSNPGNFCIQNSLRIGQKVSFLKDKTLKLGEYIIRASKWTFAS